MKTRKLTTTDAFVLLDLEDGPVHEGEGRRVGSGGGLAAQQGGQRDIGVRHGETS